jgi:hypothetical protein
MASQALDEANRVVKKQKTCSTRTDACLDTLIGLVASARDALCEDSMQDAEEVLQGLAKRVEAQGIVKELNAQTKELHSSIGKLGKVRHATPGLRPARRCPPRPHHRTAPSQAVDKLTEGQPELRKALPDVSFDQDALNQVRAGARGGAPGRLPAPACTPPAARALRPPPRSRAPAAHALPRRLRSSRSTSTARAGSRRATGSARRRAWPAASSSSSHTSPCTTSYSRWAGAWAVTQRAPCRLRCRPSSRARSSLAKTRRRRRRPAAQLRARNLQPALEWAQQHRAQLSSSGQPSSFEFSLHALQFIHVLTSSGEQLVLIGPSCRARRALCPTQGRSLPPRGRRPRAHTPSPRLASPRLPRPRLASPVHQPLAAPAPSPSPAGRAPALAYAKQHFAAFQHSRLKDIQRLMGCLLYFDRRSSSGSGGGGASSMEVDGADTGGEAAGSGSSSERPAPGRLRWRLVPRLQWCSALCSCAGWAVPACLWHATREGSCAALQWALQALGWGPMAAACCCRCRCCCRPQPLQGPAV